MERPLLTGAVEPPSPRTGPGTGGGGGEADGFNIHLYWDVLRKRRVALILSALVVLVATLVASFFMRPVYQAAATIQIDRESPNILSFEDILHIETRQDDFYQTQYMVLQSRSLLRRVIEQLRLYDHPEFASSRKPNAGESWDQRLVDQVQQHMNIVPVRSSRLVRIAVEVSDPQLAANLANAVASSYIEMNRQAKFETTETATQFLATQIETLKRGIEDDKKRIQEYATKANLSADERQNITVQRLTELNGAHTAAQTGRIEAESHYRALLRLAGIHEIPAGGLDASQVPARRVDFGRLPEVDNNPVLQGLRTRMSDLRNRESEMGRRFKPGWPELQRVREQVGELERQITTEEWRTLVGLLSQAESAYKTALGREQMLQSQLDGQRGTVEDMNRSAILYNTLKAEIDTKSQLLDSLLKRKNETDVSARLRGLKTSNIRIVDEAEVPRAPFKPNKKQNVLYALIIGLLLGVGVAFFLEYLDSTIKSLDEIERYTGLPGLAVIPLFPVNGKARVALSDGRTAAETALAPTGHPLVTIHASRSTVSEAYRSLRTSILLSAADNPPRTLLITSSQPSEGKTTTVVNTAIALAQAGKKVLLVDADLRKPRCHRLLGLANNSGLSTYLSGSSQLKDVIRPTPVRNLYVLTSGPIPPNPSELLGSERLRELVHVIPSSVNHILFDSPPVLMVTDAALLAALVDGVVLVARTGQVRRELLRRAQRQLRDVNAKIIGVVLNSADARSSDYYYYSYYAEQGYGDEVAY